MRLKAVLLLNLGCILASSLHGHSPVATQPQDDDLFQEIEGELALFEPHDIQENPLIAAVIDDQQILRDEVLFNMHELHLPYDETLKMLIERQLLLSEFEKKKATLPNGPVDSRIEEIETSNFKGNVQAMTQALQQQGNTFAGLKGPISDGIIVQMLRQRATSQSVSNISPQRIREYYETHLSDFQNPARYAIQQIGFEDHETITVNGQTILKSDYLQQLMLQKADAHTLHQLNSFSQDPIWYEEHELPASVRALNIDQCTPYHHINNRWVANKVVQKEPASTKSLASVQKEIEDKIAMEQHLQYYTDYITRLRQNAFIKIF
jgi:hypothetical protein